ncbi:MAG: hypothetical protein Q7S11_02175 [bacterium]|nr:hypothetical protein [bacterium]
MAKKILGIVLILTGLVALVVPIIPGSIIIFLGLEVAGVGLLKDRFPILKARVKNYFKRRETPQ